MFTTIQMSPLPREAKHAGKNWTMYSASWNLLHFLSSLKIQSAMYLSSPILERKLNYIILVRTKRLISEKQASFGYHSLTQMEQLILHMDILFGDDSLAEMISRLS